MLSKISYAKEQGIRLEIDRESRFTSFPANLDHHDFVILFGNLIENAFDALKDVQVEEKVIHVSVDEDDDVLAILVTDNGVGMTEEVKQHIFDNGYSTKEKNYRGIGLFLIKEIVEKDRVTLKSSVSLTKEQVFNHLLLCIMGWRASSGTDQGIIN